MSKSNVEFSRWESCYVSTWPFQVFKQYDDELKTLFRSHIAGSKSIYKYLGQSNATWSDPAKKHLLLVDAKDEKLFEDLRQWSNAYNSFSQWVRLDAVVAIASNLETYMSTVIRLAIESDPGRLIGASKTIDGLVLLKRSLTGFDCERKILACTKGDWTQRITGYRSLFGSAPEILDRKKQYLDALRLLRNKVGHAFGRDINLSRQHGVLSKMPMESISEKKLLKLQRIAWSTAKSIDRHLLHNHIGEFPLSHFYHKLYPSLPGGVHPSQRAMGLKKALGRYGGQPIGKLFCKGLVKYYESL